MSLQKVEAALKALAVTCNSFTLQQQANEALAIVRWMMSQEPVAWYDEEMDCAYTETELDGGTADMLTPLYAAPQPAEPREWLALTDAEIQKIDDETLGREDFARAMDDALRIKNSATVKESLTHHFCTVCGKRNQPRPASNRQGTQNPPPQGVPVRFQPRAP